MNRGSLRLRVAIAAAAAVLLAVAALGAATLLIVDHELRSSLDQGLRDRARDVARLSASAPALLTAPGALDAPFGGRDLVVEVLDRRGRIVARSTALGGRLLPAGDLIGRAIRTGRSDFRRATLSGEPLRMFVAPLPDAGGPASGGSVVVASSLREIEHTTERLRRLILLCALGAVALGAAAAALLTGTGLAPLRRLSAAAGEIERTGDAARRLPPAGDGEVGELTRTLNGMLAALEQARNTERRFLADASHELRTPVTALLGNVEYLARHGGEGSAEVLADLRADAARLARLVDDLLVLERQGQGPAGSGTAVVALDVVARTVAAAHDGVAVDAPAPVLVHGEAGALERAVENLVANGLSHGTGLVTISVRRRDDRALICVADNGPGLPAEQVEAAFQRFWRAPEAGGTPGSGLGLAIVRATAHAHGGEVSVAGSAFTLDLPATDPEPGTIVRDSSGSSPTLEDVPTPRSVS